MDYKKLLSNNVKKLRDKNELNQAQFAEIIDISIEALRNIEQCKSIPTAKTVNKICTSFNITPFDLLLPAIGASEADKINGIIKKLKLCNANQLDFINSTIDAMQQHL